MRQNSATTTHDAYRWGGNDPAELPPSDGIVADHFLDAIVETIDAEAPADGDALEEDEEQQAESRDGIGIEDLEDVHAALGYARHTHQVRKQAHDRDEYLLAATQQFGPLVDLRQHPRISKHVVKIFVCQDRQNLPSL